MAYLNEHGIETFKGKLDIDKAKAASLAPIFSTATTYAAGARVVKDGVLYEFTASHAAGAWTGSDAQAVQVGPELSDLKSQITEETRNLNSSPMGRWGNASDGKIYSRGNAYYGMENFINVTAGTTYTFSFGGFPASNMSWTYLFIDVSENVVARAGYSDLTTRNIIAPTGAVKLNAFCKTSNGADLNITDNMYLQIEQGNTATEYIQPISAVDAIVRDNMAKLFSINGEVLTSSTDLNTLEGLGAFRYNNGSIPTNAPVSEGGRLLNFPSDANNGAGAVQFVITNNTRTFVRYRSSTAWSTWRELATTEYVDNKTSEYTVAEGENWEG